MKEKLLSLLHEQTSPLFRIMTVSNPDDPSKRTFENNIVAFHIGGGNILTVAHNLRSEAKLIRSISEGQFQTELLAKCNPEEAVLLNRCFVLNPDTQIRHAAIKKQEEFKALTELLNKLRYDMRWVKQLERGQNKPFLIVQFTEKKFYKDEAVTNLFSQDSVFHERALGSYTFLLELKLAKAWYSEDIALYKIINSKESIISKLPVAPISFELLLPPQKLHCVQSAPSSLMGRMVNESRMEGVLEQHVNVADRYGGSFLRTGLRYLLKGYFRFGSSGAPYFIYNEEKGGFFVNAIQSEASPIQLSIKNDKAGNFQYVNAIASPLSIIKDELQEAIRN